MLAAEQNLKRFILPDCPPTLHFQGIHDRSDPENATNAFYTKLFEAGVPVINVVYPWTDHGFDLLFQQISTPVLSALYDVDRFLALMVNKN